MKICALLQTTRLETKYHTKTPETTLNIQYTQHYRHHKLPTKHKLSTTHFKPHITHNTLHVTIHNASHYITLHYPALHNNLLHYNTMQYSKLHYTTLLYTVIHYTTLQYTTLHYTAVHYTTLHYQNEDVLKNKDDLKNESVLM